MVERNLQILEPHYIDLAESQQEFDPKKITIPTKLFNIVLLSPGEWNGLMFSAEEIRNAFELTDWHDKKNYELIKDHADKPLSVGDWAGYVRDIRINSVGSLIGTLELWEEDMIIKLVLAKAKFGISAKVLGMEMEGVFTNFTFANFSIVDNPACKEAYVNLSEKGELKEIRVYHTFDGEVELAQHPDKKKKKKRKDMQNTGKTSEVNEHSHNYNIDDEGNGKTTNTTPEDQPAHTHQIVDSKVQETNDHTHSLLKGEEMAKVSNFEQIRKDKGMSASEFYAAPRDPPSSSKLPIFDAAHVRNALARFNQTQFKDEEEKTKARGKIKSAAKKFGIKVSKEFESHLIINERGSKEMAKKELEENQEVEEDSKEESKETEEAEEEESKEEEAEKSEDKSKEDLKSKLDVILSEIKKVSKRIQKLEEAEEEKESEEEPKKAEEAEPEEPKEEEEPKELKEKKLGEEEDKDEPKALSVQELSATGGIPGRHTDGTLEMSAILRRLQ